jgi:hypothetical protein
MANAKTPGQLAYEAELDMVFCEDKGAAVRDAAREYLAARSAKEEAGKKLIGLAMAV